MKNILCFVFIFSVFQIGHVNAQSPRGVMDFFDDAFSSMENAFNQNEFSAEDEYYLGRAVAANILANYKPYAENSELTRYVNRICQTIAINSLQPVIFNGYHVIILDSQEYNAFASPAGHIFLTRALVEAASSEDMLAALIAHELAHVMLRHGTTIIDDMRFYDQAGDLARQAADLAGTTQAAARLLEFRNSVSTVVDTLFLNGYSQSQEFEADRESTALLAASGYDPAALVEILQVLQNVQSTQKGGFNNTHPAPADRIANVQGLINRYRVEDTRTSRASRFKNK